MNVEIITRGLKLDTFGFSGIALNKDYAGIAFKLMDKMWQIVKSNELANKGKNIWIYEKDDIVFAGVELEFIPKPDIILEHKSLTLSKYAYYKHIGPYNLIKLAGQSLNGEIRKKGFEVDFPNVEIYGHWTNVESKLETELLMCLK
jgi:effector-binding domain-containing protein